MITLQSLEIYELLEDEITNIDALEVHPVGVQKETETGEDVCFMIDEDDSPDIAFWSVYAHLITGGVYCIADCKTKEDALNFFTFLNSLLKLWKTT